MGIPCMVQFCIPSTSVFPAENLVYIINHAGDRILFIDEDVYFLLEPLKDQLRTIEKYVILSQSGVMPGLWLSCMMI